MSKSKTLTPAAQRILDSASELFYLRGIQGVGVDLVAEAAGTTKKTLYDRFGSKEGLVVAYLQARHERWRQFVLDRVRASTAIGSARILVVLDALEEWMAGSDRGCGFTNAYAELSGQPHRGVEVVRAEKAWVRDLYIRLVTEAGLDDAERRGAQLALVHEGAIIDGTAKAPSSKRLVSISRLSFLK